MTAMWDSRDNEEIMKSRQLLFVSLAVVAMVILFGISGTHTAFAGSKLVVNDVYDVNECGMASTYTTIQAAVNAVPDGSSATILVCPGSYYGRADIQNKGTINLI